MRKFVMILLCLSLILLTACQPTLSKDAIEPKMQELSTTIAQYVDDLLIQKSLRNDEYYQLVVSDYPLVTQVSTIGYNTTMKTDTTTQMDYWIYFINSCSFRNGEIIQEPNADGFNQKPVWKSYEHMVDTVLVDEKGRFSYPQLDNRSLCIDSIVMDLEKKMDALDIPHPILGLYIMTTDGHSYPLTGDSIDYKIADYLVDFDDAIIESKDYGKLLSGSVPIENVGELRYVVATKVKS